ncbi:FAD-binding domain-containing protein [Cadophora sp. DSE1049]|nr:FAD-binding domain-containing protein [Cadophora sp. DSE1049]
MMWNTHLALLLGLPLASTSVVNARSAVDCTSPSTSEGTCQQACEILASEFPGRLHYKADDTNFTIWDQKQLQTNYACRVEPASAEEVSRILQVVVDNWCRFAVKCGGHSRFPDDSVSVGGVTIDLGLINTTLVSEDRSTARVGGGALTRQIAAALDPYGFWHGGFALGGGTSALSAKYGWALDSVLEYEVVLPNATIATVSETQHPDLYFALRGGGNNFGIVTSFNVSVFPQGPVYTGSRSFGDDQADAFLEEAERIFTLEDAEDTNIGLEYRYSYSPAQSRYTIFSTQRYLEPIMSPTVFDALNAIPALGNLTGGVNSLANSTRDCRNIFASLTHYPSVALGKQALGIFKDSIESLGNQTTISPQLITYSIPAVAIEGMRLRGGNALGIDVKGHLVINLLSVSWTSDTDDGAGDTFATSFMARFKDAAEGLGVLHPFIYTNYANKGQDVFSGYGEENKQRLIKVQKEIDPLGIFTSFGLWRGFFKVR